MGPRRAPSGVKLADFPGRAKCNGAPVAIRGGKKSISGTPSEPKKKRERKREWERGEKKNKSGPMITWECWRQSLPVPMCFNSSSVLWTKHSRLTFTSSSGVVNETFDLSFISSSVLWAKQLAWPSPLPLFCERSNLLDLHLYLCFVNEAFHLSYISSSVLWTRHRLTITSTSLLWMKQFAWPSRLAPCCEWSNSLDLTSSSVLWTKQFTWPSRLALCCERSNPLELNV